jgi:hypothetical protein
MAAINDDAARVSCKQRIVGTGRYVILDVMALAAMVATKQDRELSPSFGTSHMHCYHDIPASQNNVPVQRWKR